MKSSMATSPPSLAVAHDWLIHARGAERLLREFCSRLPKSVVYTLICRERGLPAAVARQAVYVSNLNRLPGVSRYYRLLLPFLGKAISSLRVEEGNEALLSISHSVAKGVGHPDDLPHFCYCLTPMRYLWEREVYGDFMSRQPLRTLMSRLEKRLKKWDLATNQGVTEFVAISRTVQDRIERFYGRKSRVIFPGTDFEVFRPLGKSREDFFLVVSALVPQKRIDLAIEAFNQNRRTLLIVGEGPLRLSLALRARSNIQFLGVLSNLEIRSLYARARALIFPGIEDFGLVPVEAQACGCPVLAYRDGGATETVVAGRSGHFFDVQTADALNQALDELLRERWPEEQVSRQVEEFSMPRFRSEWNRFFQQQGLRIKMKNDA